MSDTASSSGSARWRRAGPSLAVALLGFAIVTAVRTPHPGPRSGRAHLIDLIAQEDARSRSLRREVDDLQARLETLERSSGTGVASLRSIQQQLDRLGLLAGLQAVRGPGVEVVLRDSTRRRAPSGDPNDLVIHEQDLQAIVNGLWNAGAEAIAINGERLTSDSAVRCVGNTLLLHGAVYAPPYRIDAIGNPARLAAGLARDPLASRFATLAADLRLGFSVRRMSSVALPGFLGALGSQGGVV